jgi:hypothetical protein
MDNKYQEVGKRPPHMYADIEIHERLLPRLIVHDVNDMNWANSVDVVVGCRGAGAVTALQAKELGIAVLAIDGFAAPCVSNSSPYPPGRDFPGDENDAGRH